MCGNFVPEIKKLASSPKNVILALLLELVHGNGNFWTEVSFRSLGTPLEQFFVLLVA
jgi:hypothetical protein